MRRVLAATVPLLLAVAPAQGGPARVAPGISSGNVEYVTTVPFEAGGATGAARVGKYLYVAGAKSFSIYDISDPLDPQLMSITPIGFYFANEDVDTNGKILLIASDQGTQDLQKLTVYDVEDKDAPVKIADVQARDHNFECVLGCRWAYGSRGTIVDLRNPRAPKRAGIWGVGMGPGDGFDTTEVAPGLVLAATRPLQLIDGRKDPARPTILARGAAPDPRLLHSVGWPRRARDRFLLVQGETFGETRCESDSGAFMTWDTRGWTRTHTFKLVDEYRTDNGSYADGSPAASAFGCTAMWFEEHPSFHDGGLVATAWFEHGTRFLDVDRRGAIREVGYFMPFGGATIAAYWVTDEIVYAVDIERGIDILRYER
jgi:hypothetical protein